MSFIGYFLISTGFLLCFKMLIFEIDSFYRSFKRIRYVRLDKDSFEVSEEDLEEMLDQIADAEPISGCGMFEITRSTLTSMMSISATYLIILLQFKLSF